MLAMFFLELADLVTNPKSDVTYMGTPMCFPTFFLKRQVIHPLLHEEYRERYASCLSICGERSVGNSWHCPTPAHLIRNEKNYFHLTKIQDGAIMLAMFFLELADLVTNP